MAIALLTKRQPCGVSHWAGMVFQDKRCSHTGASGNLPAKSWTLSEHPHVIWAGQGETQYQQALWWHRLTFAVFFTSLRKRMSDAGPGFTLKLCTMGLYRPLSQFTHHILCSQWESSVLANKDLPWTCCEVWPLAVSSNSLLLWAQSLAFEIFSSCRDGYWLMLDVLENSWSSQESLLDRTGEGITLEDLGAQLEAH